MIFGNPGLIGMLKTPCLDVFVDATFDCTPLPLLQSHLRDIWSFHKFLLSHSVRSDDVKVQGGLLTHIQTNSCNFPVVNQGSHIVHWFWSGNDEGNGYHVWRSRWRNTYRLFLPSQAGLEKAAHWEMSLVQGTHVLEVLVTTSSKSVEWRFKSPSPVTPSLRSWGFYLLTMLNSR